MKTEHIVRSLFKSTFLTLLLFIVACESDTAVDEEVISQEEEIPEEGNTPGDPVENTARLAAKQLYEDYYASSKTESGDVAWTGDEPSCATGDVPQATKNKIFARLEYFRKAVGLNNTVAENATKSDKAQAAALMMHANNELDHFPPNSWKCFSPEGKEAAGKSLLTTARNAESIDSYMRDAGSSNGPVGHRRWLLWPRLQEIGIGNTSQANAIWVIGNAGSPPSDAPEFISWPPQGYSPGQFAYARWSFSIAGADFSNTQVGMKDAMGNPISLALEELDPAYGDPTIVWVPNGIQPNVSEDTLYTVTLTNVEVSGSMKDFEYEVILFDVNG
ncbi:hypothetical protein FK220_013800 [Flavobacteriaceae bacterium TP-CH-4]|uniref:SCP domain-containing protein n=1 Tax=Pelagihabitans pacificus TaxID=2696054 RepID=A0A967EEJ1_9FLAO|nr:CAP domain-containing protein [Pelagihabitans pacificus]NHF60423.1 hypothetical protein [Pelagihabitans pacificus]